VCRMVQPEADQPKAETGADQIRHRPIENRGASLWDDKFREG